MWKSCAKTLLFYLYVPSLHTLVKTRHQSTVHNDYIQQVKRSNTIENIWSMSGDSTSTPAFGNNQFPLSKMPTTLTYFSGHHFALKLLPNYTEDTEYCVLTRLTKLFAVRKEMLFLNWYHSVLRRNQMVISCFSWMKLQWS
jgi:hypothetical protein